MKRDCSLNGGCAGMMSSLSFCASSIRVPKDDVATCSSPTCKLLRGGAIPNVRPAPAGNLRDSWSSPHQTVTVEACKSFDIKCGNWIGE